MPQALRETVMLDRRQRKWGRPQETSGNWQEGAWGPVGREKEGARYCREVPGEGPAMPGTQRGTACELRSDHRSLRAAEGRNGRGKPRRLQVRRSDCRSGGQRARGSVRDSTIPNPQRAEGCGRLGPGGPWCRGQCPHTSRCLTQEEGMGPELVSTSLELLLGTPGSCTKGKGGARGLAHVRRVWRAATV